MEKVPPQKQEGKCIKTMGCGRKRRGKYQAGGGEDGDIVHGGEASAGQKKDRKPKPIFQVLLRRGRAGGRI